jgi:two-component system phosphate regulon response regulator PhoB
MHKPNVVLIDDEKDLLEVLKQNLQEEFHIHPFTDTHHALSFLEKNEADAVVLDYHIPGQNTFEVFTQMRMKNMMQPVLFLTGETNPEVKLNGLDLGVDDFLHKPITTSELCAYLKNRIRSHQKRHPQRVTIGNLEMCFSDTQVTVEGKALSLTPKEFDILSMLVSRPNLVVKKEEIIERIWPDVKVEENNIDTHMSNLRKKLKGFSCRIKTIKCIGYVLRT